jgi:hypothetical protein
MRGSSPRSSRRGSPAQAQGHAGGEQIVHLGRGRAELAVAAVDIEVLGLEPGDARPQVRGGGGGGERAPVHAEAGEASGRAGQVDGPPLPVIGEELADAERVNQGLDRRALMGAVMIDHRSAAAPPRRPRSRANPRDPHVRAAVRPPHAAAVPSIQLAEPRERQRRPVVFEPAEKRA